MRPIKCIMNLHNFYTEREEKRPDIGIVLTSRGTLHNFDGIHRHEICSECGWERVTEYGSSYTQKPWEMSVRKLKWDKEAREYL